MTTQRDLERLQKPVFKTMIEPLHQQTKDELKGWKPPKGAYVLLEALKFNVGTNEWYRSTAIVYVEGRPMQIDKINDRLSKNCRILHFDNFPSHDSPNAARRRAYEAHNDPNGPNHWDVLKSELKRLMYGNDIVKLRKDNADLETRARLAEARAAEAEAKLKENGDGNKDSSNSEPTAADKAESDSQTASGSQGEGHDAPDAGQRGVSEAGSAVEGSEVRRGGRSANRKP